jgi:hypothetical protein
MKAVIKTGTVSAATRTGRANPDFLTPAESAPDFESALELTLATPRRQIRSQLDLLSTSSSSSTRNMPTARPGRTKMRRRL